MAMRLSRLSLCVKLQGSLERRRRGRRRRKDARLTTEMSLGLTCPGIEFSHRRVSQSIAKTGALSFTSRTEIRAMPLPTWFGSTAKKKKEEELWVYTFQEKTSFLFSDQYFKRKNVFKNELDTDIRCSIGRGLRLQSLRAIALQFINASLLQ